MKRDRRTMPVAAPRSIPFGRRWVVGALSVAVLSVAACGSPMASPSQAGAPATAAAPGQAQPTSPAAASPVPAGSPVAAAPAGATATTKLNLNTATREQFLAVPGVGDRMVREFFEYRPYLSIQQFRREIGKYVSQDQVAAYEQYVFVPIDPNNADADTLQQLPGVDASIASQLAAGRPYATADAFLTNLGQYLAPDQVAAARAYLDPA
jgi:DNA uptake protein ComE-like DNA-binding protein